MSRVKTIQSAHPYLSDSAIRAMLVVGYTNLDCPDEYRQEHMEDLTETLCELSEHEILNHKARVAERFTVSLD